ncbi:hypothetical protein Q5P01_003148 [Channa striata]|uniref:Ig-like domain-containing protein n=1 Tax=Channa striata TaxID=64152 RepID=A0AA88TEL5_CHASR|nr:hypothetical protein Q5P01_003148 [Channa striata]
MKTPPVSLMPGVSVLLLSALTVSPVSLNVRLNLQQFFTKDPPVSLNCVEDGQTVDGWTVKRTRGGRTEECGAAGSDFQRLNGSSCVLDLTKPFSTVYWCGTSSGQRSVPVTITVTDKDLILEIPALPVVRGSDVTMCYEREGRVKAYFYINGKAFGDTVKSLDVTISKVQQSDEGPHSCSTDAQGGSTESRLKVRGPPTTSDPPHTTTSSTTSDPPHTTTSSTTSDPPHTTALYTDTTCNSTDSKVSFPSLIVFSVVGSLVLLVLVAVGLMRLSRKNTGWKSDS